MLERFKMGVLLGMFVVFAFNTSLSAKSNWVMVTMVKNVLLCSPQGIQPADGSYAHTGLDVGGCSLIFPAIDSISDPIHRWKWGLIAWRCLGTDGAAVYWNTPLQRALLSRSLYYDAKLGNVSAHDDRITFLRSSNCQSAEECFFLGRMLMEQGNILSAISYLEQAIVEISLWSSQSGFGAERVDDDFSFFNVYVNLARSFLALGHLGRAQEAYLHAVNLNRQNDMVLRELGWTYYKSTKQLEPALTFFLHAAEHTKSAQNWFAIAELYSLTGSLDRALYYADLGAKFGAPASAELVRARAYLRAGHLVLALDSAHKALQLGAIKSDTFVILGEAYLELGQWNEAIKYYQQAISLKPKSWEILCRLARAYQLAKQDPNAEQEFLRARQLDPAGKGCPRQPK